MRYFVIEADGKLKMQHSKPKPPYKLRNKGTAKLIDKNSYEVYATNNDVYYMWTECKSFEANVLDNTLTIKNKVDSYKVKYPYLNLIQTN